MDTEDIPHKVANNWEPITNPLLIAMIGKTIEELSELSGALARMLIQGINELEPESKNGKPPRSNKQIVEDEIADVYAKMHTLTIELGLDVNNINQRMLRKQRFSRSWFDYLRQKDIKGDI